MKLFNFKRNQVIITALVVMIGIAGYLNYIETTQQHDGMVFITDDDFNASLIPNTNLTAPVSGFLSGVDDDEIGITLAPDSTTPTAEPGAAVLVNANVNEFFVQARLDREQTRAQSRQVLTELINNENVQEPERVRSAEAMINLQERLEQETASESMIEARGFGDVYVRIGDNTVDVVVSQERLSEAETAQILDIVSRKTGVGPENVFISSLRR